MVHRALTTTVCAPRVKRVGLQIGNINMRKGKRSTQCPALEIDWTDSETWVGIAAAVLGLGVGIGAPIFYANRIEEDEKNLEELRKLNRETYKETGQYLSEEEIEAIRTPKWTDRREFVDDD